MQPALIMIDHGHFQQVSLCSCSVVYRWLILLIYLDSTALCSALHCGLSTCCSQSTIFWDPLPSVCHWDLSKWHCTTLLSCLHSCSAGALRSQHCLNGFYYSQNSVSLCSLQWDCCSRHGYRQWTCLHKLYIVSSHLLAGYMKIKLLMYGAPSTWSSNCETSFL